MKIGGLWVVWVGLFSALFVQGATVAYYRFGDDGYFYGDSSGNGYTLTQVDEDEVAQFESVSGFPVVIPQSGATNRYSALFAIGTNLTKALQAEGFADQYSPEFTVEAFVRPAGFRDISVVAGQWDPDRRSWLLFFNENGDQDQLTLQLYDGSNVVSCNLPVPLNKYQCYYVAAVVQTNGTGSVMKLYCRKNDEALLSASKTVDFHVYDSGDPLMIGGRCNGYGNLIEESQFGGNIDEFRFSDQALETNQFLESVGSVYYVSPDGSDSNPGTDLDSPFLTVTKARDVVRSVLATNSVSDVHVWLRGGAYPLNEPVLFGTNDSASAFQTVTYQAWDDETPVFSSDVPLAGWEEIDSLSELPAGCPTQAVEQVYWTDVSGVVSARSALIAAGKSILPHPRITELYDTVSGTKVPQSSTDGFEPETMRGTPDFLGGERLDFMVYPEGVLQDYEDITDAELHIVPSQDWTMNILPIRYLIESNRLAKTDIEGLYYLNSNKKWWLQPNAWIKNVPWGLAPGKWFYSSSQERLYYWSPDGNAPAANQFVASNGMLEYFKIGSTNEPVRGLVFKGLTFTRGSRSTWPEDYRTTRWMSAWAGYDEANALLRFRGAEDCRVENCRFVNSAAAGVRLDLHCQNIRVTGCEFGHLGESGVILSGYGAGYADVNFGNRIENNWFHHGSESYWHSPAIFVTQSGNNYIARNLIHHYGYGGIIVCGVKSFTRGGAGLSQGLMNWDRPELAGVNYIEYPDVIPYLYASNNIVTGNEIFRVMDGNMGDGNAIYVHAAPLGNEVSYNYCHDIRGNCAAALRTDYFQWGVLFSHNVICRSTGEGLVIKGMNDAINNYFVNQQDGFTLDGTNTSYLAVRLGPNTNTVVRNNIYAHMAGPQQPEFYDFETMDESKPVQTELMTVDSNVFWYAGHSSYVDQLLTDLRQAIPNFDANSVNADPGFVDWENGDFRLTETSPARALGIESLDVREIGLMEPFRSEVYLNPTGSVVIAPASHVFNGPTNITMSAPAGMTIRYTLDGAEPTTNSAVYSSAFAVANPLVIRAKMFGDGIVDRLGARTIIYPWTQPIYETFEPGWKGISWSRLTFTDTDVITNADTSTAGHGYALRFNAGGNSSLKTYGSYKLTHGYGDVEVAFDAYLDGTNLMFKIQWRDSEQFAESSTVYVGPNLIVAEGGELQYNSGSALTSLPLKKWFHVVMEADLSSADPDFTLRITPEGGSEQVYSGLSCLHEDFMDLEYLTFLLRGSDSIYIDNVSIRKR